MSRLGTPSSAFHSPSGFLLWRGGLLYRTGYTSLTVKYRRVGSISGAARLQIYINGALQASIVPVSGDGQAAISLVGWGYVDGSALLIEIRTTGLSGIDRTSEWWVMHVYATPSYIAGPPLSDPSLPVIVPVTPKPVVNAARPWIPMSNFASVWDQTKLNILGNNILHLYDRMNQVPLVGQRATTWAIITHRLETDFEVWSGTASKYTSVDQFQVIGNITVFGGTDTLKVYMNDVLVATLGPYGVGSTAFSQTIAFPAGTPIPGRVRIKITTTTTTQRPPSLGSRINLTLMRSTPAGGTFPALSLSDNLTTGPLYSATAIATFLNKMTTALNTIKSRIDNSGSFTVVRAAQDNFGYDDHARRSLERTHPMVIQRRGSRLVVYGKNVVLGFGGQTFETDENGVNTYKYKFNNEQNLIQGDKFEMKTIYLDSIKGLYPGDLYYLIGDFYFASEYHK
jgi:hypothetical protein